MIKPIDHIINIDLAKKINMNKSINIKKNDTNSHKFIINIFDNSVPYNLTGSTARIYFEKADKTTVFADCTIDNALTGKVSYLLKTQEVSYQGEVATEVTIYGADGEILTSITFDFTVKDTVRNDAAIESTSEFTALTNALNAVNDAVGSLPTVAALNIDLQENIITGDALKTDLETNIVTGNTLKGILESDILTAEEKIVVLESVIATADLTTYASKGSVDSVVASLADIVTEVKAHGIKPDGTDNKLSIQTLLDTFVTGGEITFSRGEYVVSGALKPLSNTRLIFQKGAVLKSSNVDDSIIIIDGKTNVEIKGGEFTYNQEFNFNNINETSGTGNEHGLIAIINSSTRCKVSNSILRDSKRIGVLINKSNSNVIEKCYLNKLYGFFAIRVSADSHFNIIKENHIDTVTHVGIGIYGGVAGLDNEIIDTPCTQNIITNNIIENVQRSIIVDGGIGIELHNWQSHNIVIGNTVKLCDSMGISCTNGKVGYKGGCCTISNNTIKNMYGNSYAGIELSDVESCTVTGNVIDNIFKNGIIIDTCNYSVISDNVITQTVTNSITRLINVLASNNCRIKGNIIDRIDTLNEACISVGTNCNYVEIEGNTIKNGIYSITMSGIGIGCKINANNIDSGVGAITPIMLTKGGCEVKNNHVISSNGYCIVCDANETIITDNYFNNLSTTNARCVQIQGNHNTIAVTNNTCKTSDNTANVNAIYNSSAINIIIARNIIIGLNHVIRDNTGMLSYKEGNIFISDPTTNTARGSVVFENGVPVSKPNYKGQFYFDETIFKLYFAKNIVDPSDWILLN